MADAGMTASTDAGMKGWHVIQRESAGADAEATAKFRVEFRPPADAGKNRGGNLAELEFKAGLLTALKWNN